jgi:glucose/arabinose dehydrogenase
LFALLLPAAALAADPPKPTVVAKDIKNLRSVCVTPDGRTLVAAGKDKDGAVLEVKDGQTTKLADVASPGVMVPFQGWLFVAGKDGVHRVELATKKVELWAGVGDFPGNWAGELSGISVDERGTVYVSDHSGVYSIGMKPGPRGKPPVRGDIRQVMAPKEKLLAARAAVMSDGLDHVYVTVLDGSEALARMKLKDGSLEQLADGLGFTSAICGDVHGRVFILCEDRLWGIPRPGEKPVKLLDEMDWGLSIAYHPVTRQLLLTNKDSLVALPATIPGWEVDETPLPVETEPAFADVKWTGWDDGQASGKVNRFRPIVLTHAGDGSGRTFVATQHGVIHIVEKGAKESKVFLDIQAKTLFKDTEDEQGLLGLAFHPNYKTNGEFFAFYTDKSKVRENVLCRFRVSKDDPNKADPASEQELMRISHKYWNHDGGTVCFGPDGYLYLVLGDGGSANDPDDHGQKTDTLLGKILRIDINAKGENTPYAIPKDNPFVGNAKYRPEIYALGVRNPWRLSFDRKTGQGWFGEVGQNLWEEINLLEKGANYGWRRRESLHPFGADGTGPKKEFTDPIWEYHHEVGKSITGGHVYRGTALPALDGYYLYADYVTKRVWGLKYDEKAKRVTANRPIKAADGSWMSFGEDEAGGVRHVGTMADSPREAAHARLDRQEAEGGAGEDAVGVLRRHRPVHRRAPGGQDVPLQTRRATAAGRRGPHRHQPDRGPRPPGVHGQGGGRGREAVRAEATPRATGRPGRRAEVPTRRADGGDDRRGERERQDDQHRQAGVAAENGRQEGAGGGVRHLPRRGGGATDRVVRADRGGHHQAAAGVRPGGGGP